MNLRKFFIVTLAAAFAIAAFQSGSEILAGEKTVSYEAPKPVPNMKFKNFPSVKKALYRVSAFTVEKTFYCGCDFNPGTREVDLASCGYRVRKNKKRASKTEAEHIVPADRMCGETVHWKEGAPECVTKKGKPYKGRKCASEFHPVCNMAHNDLRNLKPAIGEVNSDRSNFAFGDFWGRASGYGQCDFMIDRKKKIARPASDVRGDIARIYLFMAQAYSELFTLTPQEQALFQKWSKEDPVTRKECRWNAAVAKEQGAGNSVVQIQCDKLANY